jgi:hypothetical protein
MGSINTFDITQIRNKFNINTFIETGTLWGAGVDYALASGFERIISIEINETLANSAKNKYINEPRVTIIQGNSSLVLVDILKNIKEPVLFWLDAHFPGADANLAAYKTELDAAENVPLEAELNIISQRLYKDIIICDDLWLYEDVPQSTWGSFNDHCKRYGHNVTREDLVKDGMPAVFEQMFINTHNMSRDYNDQGFLIFKPK